MIHSQKRYNLSQALEKNVNKQRASIPSKMLISPSQIMLRKYTYKKAFHTNLLI